jgi:hypothetical protein
MASTSLDLGGQAGAAFCLHTCGVQELTPCNSQRGSSKPGQFGIPARDNERQGLHAGAEETTGCEDACPHEAGDSSDDDQSTEWRGASRQRAKGTIRPPDGGESVWGGGGGVGDAEHRSGSLTQMPQWQLFQCRAFDHGNPRSKCISGDVCFKERGEVLLWPDATMYIALEKDV